MRISDWSSDVCSSDLVGIRVRGHLGDADDAGHGTVGMVEKHLVAGSHAVAHEVARLVIAHAVPGFLLLALQLVDRERVRFGLHKPVVHAFASGLQSISSRSVATKSRGTRSEEHTSELQSLMRISYAVFCLKQKN